MVRQKTTFCSKKNTNLHITNTLALLFSSSTPTHPIPSPVIIILQPLSLSLALFHWQHYFSHSLRAHPPLLSLVHRFSLISSPPSSVIIIMCCGDNLKAVREEREGGKDRWKKQWLWLLGLWLLIWPWAEPPIVKQISRARAEDGGRVFYGAIAEREEWLESDEGGGTQSVEG